MKNHFKIATQDLLRYRFRNVTINQFCTNNATMKRLFGILLFIPIFLVPLLLALVKHNELVVPLPKPKHSSLNNYNISTTCKLRENRLNPRKNPELFPCPVKSEWGSFVQKDFVDWDFSQLPLSSYECTDEIFCKYNRVCVKGNVELTRTY
jgi:hypothetical protein